jgi:A/G-specific adenine glycosylase
MLALPSSAWAVDARPAFPFEADWQLAPAPVRHGFTHFELELTIARAEAPARLNSLDGESLIWTAVSEVATAGLPTLFVRAAAAAHALSPPTARETETAAP